MEKAFFVPCPFSIFVTDYLAEEELFGLQIVTFLELSLKFN